MNEAQNLMANLGVQTKEQKRMELAGAMTRMIYNEVVAEAKKRAAIRDAAMTPQTPAGETPSQNG